ncbi:MAG: cobyrinate a,c-diamide synthase [Thermodesulfovibrionales bacterium]|nr:cobyrinate a,c-diamide synthase [Thermodesulfovibrionales bacterium]
MFGALIAGTHSGCGKTTITLGIMAALKRKGLKVQPFKAGPDFIDAGLHRLITGRASRNLDLWMCGGEYVKDCFNKYSQDADAAIVEGVMGLYDGDLSSARLASILGLPVILVVDAYGMAESAGAIAKGFKDWRAAIGINIGGAIFNRVGSERHYGRIKNAVKDIEVLGCLPRDLNFEIPHRHLGLTVAEENPIADENIERLADAVLEHVNVKAIIGRDDCLPLHSRKNGQEGDCPRFTDAAVESGLSPTSTIAVAYDTAFCFYYEDNLDLLKEAGAEIIKFSPLEDSQIPASANAIYIGGGYPELYAKELSGNTAMLKSIKEWSDAGRPLYAECGGLMYISKGIHDFDGNFFSMANILPIETRMKKGGPSLGYREITLREDCILGRKGDILRGHEFHYSEIRNSAEVRKSGSSEERKSGREIIDEIYSVWNNYGEPVNASGYKYKNTLASYVHLHFGSNPRAAENFLKFAKEN